MPELITIGETMVAFTPKHTGFRRYIKDYEMRIAGAESNLNIGVCKMGYTAGWVRCWGKDEFGHLRRPATGAGNRRFIYKGIHRSKPD